MDKVAVALEILRNDELLEEMAKRASVLGGIANVFKAGDRGGKAAADFLRSKGHENLATVARVAPYAATLYGAKKVYDTEAAQGLKRKYQEYKYRRAMRQAQQGY
jgi:hypothetical protein